MTDDLPTLRVQVVVYRNDTDSILRSLESIFNALVRSSDMLRGWCVAIGDSSPNPALDEKTLMEAQRTALGAGGAFEYQFFDENLGHGGGHNRLHESSEEDLLLILNPDGILAPDTVSRLMEALTPEYGIVDARQVPIEHPKEYDAATGDASWSSLACALTPSAVFRSVGGIDHDTFFMYCDDVDYSWRVRLAGLKVRYCPQARMFHDKRIDVNGQMGASESELYYSVEAALMLAYKYSRNDVLQTLLAEMEGSTDSYQQRARQTFLERRRLGTLPKPIDENHEVAEFVGRTYGAHRF